MYVCVRPGSVTSALPSTPTGAPTVTASGTGTLPSPLPPTSAGGGPTAPNGTNTTTYPAYPCPEGFDLTYIEQNATLPRVGDKSSTGIRELATSPVFPNITNSTGTNALVLRIL